MQNEQVDKKTNTWLKNSGSKLRETCPIYQKSLGSQSYDASTSKDEIDRNFLQNRFPRKSIHRSIAESSHLPYMEVSWSYLECNTPG